MTTPFDGPVPPEIAIAVTTEDIRLGEPRSGWRDPVCRAVCRQLGVPIADNVADMRVSVDGAGLDIWTEAGGDAITYLLPDDAVAFLEAFGLDGPLGLGPFTFTARRLDQRG